MQIVAVDKTMSAEFMVSAIHNGATGMSRTRASGCFQFHGFMDFYFERFMDKATTLQSVLGVALYVVFQVMVR